MANLHGFWMNCLHCPIVFIMGVGMLVVGFGALLVSTASFCCKQQSNHSNGQETQQNSSGSEADVLHVVF